MSGWEKNSMIILKKQEKFFKKSDEILKEDFSSLIFNGPVEKLNLTENTQPSVLTCSVAFYKLFKKIGS